MNKNVIVSLLIILMVVATSVVYFGQKSEENTIKNTPKSEVVKVNPEVIIESDSEIYVEYSSPQTLETGSAKKVLFFYANWCPTCIPVDKEFKNNSNQIPEGVSIVRVNYNDPDTDSNEKELAKKYGITYQHTFVQIDENGNVLTKWNGGGLSELISNLK